MNPTTLGSHEWGHLCVGVATAHKHGVSSLTGTLSVTDGSWAAATDILNQLPGDRLTEDVVLPLLLIEFLGGSLGEHVAADRGASAAELRQRCMVKWFRGDLWTPTAWHDEAAFNRIANGLPKKEVDHIVLKGIADVVPVIHDSLRAEPLRPKRLGELLLDHPVGKSFEVPLI